MRLWPFPDPGSKNVRKKLRVEAQKAEAERAGKAKDVSQEKGE